MNSICNRGGSSAVPLWPVFSSERLWVTFDARCSCRNGIPTRQMLGEESFIMSVRRARHSWLLIHTRLIAKANVKKKTKWISRDSQSCRWKTWQGSRPSVQQTWLRCDKTRKSSSSLLNTIRYMRRIANSSFHQNWYLRKTKNKQTHKNGISTTSVFHKHCSVDAGKHKKNI